MNENIDHEIIIRWYAGRSMRGVAEELGVSRHRVAEVLAAHRQGRTQGGLAGEPGQPKQRRRRPPAGN